MAEVIGPILQWAGFVLWALLLLVASLLVYVGLGGNFVILALALIYALATGFESIGWLLLAAMLAMAVAGEIIESVLGIYYVARKGATRHGVIGAFVGGLAGAALGSPVVPVVGTVIGGFVGAFAGAVAGEYLRESRLEPSLRIGGHAFIGKMAAILVKHAIGLGMVLLILRATWPR